MCFSADPKYARQFCCGSLKGASGLKSLPAEAQRRSTASLAVMLSEAEASYGEELQASTFNNGVSR